MNVVFRQLDVCATDVHRTRANILPSSQTRPVGTIERTLQILHRPTCHKSSWHFSPWVRSGRSWPNTPSATVGQSTGLPFSPREGWNRPRSEERENEAAKSGEGGKRKGRGGGEWRLFVFVIDEEGYKSSQLPQSLLPAPVQQADPQTRPGADQTTHEGTPLGPMFLAFLPSTKLIKPYFPTLSPQNSLVSVSCTVGGFWPFHRLPQYTFLLRQIKELVW